MRREMITFIIDHWNERHRECLGGKQNCHTTWQDGRSFSQETLSWEGELEWRGPLGTEDGDGYRERWGQGHRREPSGLRARGKTVTDLQSRKVLRAEKWLLFGKRHFYQSVCEKDSYREDGTAVHVIGTPGVKRWGGSLQGGLAPWCLHGRRFWPKGELRGE